MMTLIWKSLYETLTMVGAASFFSILFGIPLGVFLRVTAKGGLYECFFISHTAGFLINCLRSIPYIILTVLIMPLTKVMMGSSIGTGAAIVPLTLAGGVLVARMAEESMRQVPQGLIEVGIAAGASRWQIITTIILPESLPGCIAGATTVIVNLVGFSAMAGAVGGGGLGDLAIRYGYQRWDWFLVWGVVLILICIVQCIQIGGQTLIKYAERSSFE